MKQNPGTPRLDRRRLKLKPLSERVHDLRASSVMPLESRSDFNHPSIPHVAAAMESARDRGSAVVMMMGGHVVRSGAQRFIIDLMERGLITCLSMNGSCVIHDYELALIGATTESVARYVAEGQFGLWSETGGINDIVNVSGGVGMGAAVGKAIAEGQFPHKDISLLAACHRLAIPATVHIGIGYDIIHELPNFDPAASGRASYEDFLTLAGILGKSLEGGVVMNFGSAVMAPEVFLKALSMARNIAHQQSRQIADFTTAVFDIRKIDNSMQAEPPKDSEGYYFRPWKTMLVRTVADGGTSHYVQGTHAETIPALWRALSEEAAS